MSKAKSIYFIEVTDTYAGEANYCWVRRFKVHASSVQGAMRKVSTKMGFNARKVYDSGDMARYDFKDATICAFVMGYENQAEQYLRVESI
jgi:hypothetical protein